MPIGQDSNLNIVVKLKDEASKKLRQINDEMTEVRKESEQSFEEIARTSRMAGAAITGTGVAMGGLLVKTGLTAARVEVLGTVMEQVGKVSGLSADYLYEQEEAVKELGITTRASREILTLFMQSQLDVADASKVARVAQDLAVISGQNSSEAAKTLTNAISAQRPVLLRQFGIVKDLNVIYRDYGKELGIVEEKIDSNGEVTRSWSRELTDVEKRQAMLNTVLEEGEKVAGTYEAAMEDVGKQIGSLDRLIEEAEVAFGTAFLPVMREAVDALMDFLDWFNNLDPAIQQQITQFVMLATAVALVLGPILLLIGFLPALISGLTMLGAVIGVGAATFGILAAAIIAIVGVIAWWVMNWEENIETLEWAWKEFVDFVKEKWNSIIQPIKDALSSMWKAIVNVFTDIGDFLKGVIAILGEDVLAPAFVPLMDAVLSAEIFLKDVWEVISGFITNIWEKITNFLQKRMEKTKEKMDTALNFLKKVWKTVWEFMSEKVKEAWEKIKSPVERIKKAFQSVIDLAKSVGQEVRNAVTTISQRGQGFSLPSFQGGGIVPGPIGAPVPAIVHGGERVIPPGKSGESQIVINITGNTLLDENSAERIGDMIIRQLKYQTKLTR